MIDQGFINGLCERIPLDGLPVLLTFGADMEPWKLTTYLLAFEIRVIRIDRDDPRTRAAWQRKADVAYDTGATVKVWLKPMPETRDQMFPRLLKYLENIAPAEEHPLSGLCSTSAADHQSVINLVRRHWVVTEIERALASNGLSLKPQLVEERGFRMLKLSLTNGSDVLHTYSLDGWSGLMRHDDRWMRARPVTRHSFKQAVLRDIETFETASSNFD